MAHHEAASEKVDLVVTDESGVYRRMNRKRTHEFVTHGRGGDVRGNAHTCSVDGFWSLLNRGIIVTLHNVSAKYLSICVSESGRRLNNGDNADIFGIAITWC